MDKAGFLFLSIALFFAAASSAHAFQGNYTAYANASIHNASAYLQSINQSGYLLFYPQNLSGAYAYLDKAIAAYPNSPALSVEYSNEAVNAASKSYAQIGYYRNASIIVMIAFTATVGFFLYRHMKPMKAPKKK